MSIEQTLERIAAGIEKLIEMQGGATTAPVAAAPVAAAPVAAAPVAAAPVAAAPMPGPSGTGPGQAIPPVAAAPVAAAPVAGPDRNALLDQIREAANAFHRAHPERAGEVWTAITQAGGNTNGGINSIPEGRETQALQIIQQLGA